MSFKVQVRRAAELDIAEAQVWYETQRAGLGAEFHFEISKVFTVLTETPLIYPALYRDARRAIVHRFPYLIWSVFWRGGHDSSLYARSTEPQQGHLSFSVEDLSHEDRLSQCSTRRKLELMTLALERGRAYHPTRAARAGTPVLRFARFPTCKFDGLEMSIQRLSGFRS